MNWQKRDTAMAVGLVVASLLFAVGSRFMHSFGEEAALGCAISTIVAVWTEASRTIWPRS